MVDPQTGEQCWFDKAETYEALAERLVHDTGVELPPHGSYIAPVYGPGCTLAQAFTLYDSSRPAWIYREPDEDTYTKIREAFGFEGEPGWFPDTMELYWR